MTTFRTATCPTCSAVVADGDRFCKQCGTEVSGISASMFAGPGAPTSPAVAPGLPAGSPWEQVLTRLRAVTAGEFDVGRELGRGGMAAVFLAQDVALNRRVAIKVMAPGLMMGDDMIQRFRREAITIANLQHANIVTVHAVRQMADLHFFVMQFVEGQSLDGVLRARGALPAALVLPMLHQVGSALAYAHRRGVIHRDIKPGNILLSGDGDALVTDFGIAKVAEGPAQTQTGMVVGTPSYMSPEQCFATELDGASDQYSLGIVAYQMLCGRVPFVGGTFEIMKGHTTEPVPPMREFVRDVPAKVEKAILRMLAKKPTDRFPSFGEALATMGAEPLGEHSPLRAEMVRLAAVEERREALGDLLRTPSSPVSGARSGSRAGPTPRTPAPATTIAVAIAPVATDVEVGESITLRASVRGADASMLEWTTSTPSIVQVDASSGVLHALAVGDAMVTAHVGRVDEYVSLRVVPPRVASLRTAPVPGDVRVGDTLVLTAEALDRRGQPLARPVVWRATGSSAVVDGEGVVHARTIGRTDITVTCESITETVILQVLPARVARVEIITPVEHLEVGHAVTLSAMVHDAHGVRLSDRALQWSVDRPERARIDAAGVLSLLGDGSLVVHAVCEGVESSSALTIAPARAVSVSITGVPALLRDGDRFTLAATPRDARGTALTRAVAWRSSQPGVATIDATGAVHAHEAGATDITAAIDDVSSSVSLVVHATPPLFAPTAAPSSGVSTPASATAVLPGLEGSRSLVGKPRAPAGDEIAAAAIAPAAKPAPTKPDSDSATKRPAAEPAVEAVLREAAPIPGASLSGDRAAAGALPRTGEPARGRPVWLYGVAVVPVALAIWFFTKDPDTTDAPGTQTPSGQASDVATATTPPAISTPAETLSGAGDTVGRSTVASSPTTDSATRPETPSGPKPVETSGDVLLWKPPARTTLRVDESLRLTASTQDRVSGRATRGTIRFRSSDPAIARVDPSGVVTAVSAGRVTITAEAGDAGRGAVTLTVAALEVAQRPDTAPTLPPNKPPLLSPNAPTTTLKKDSGPSGSPTLPVAPAISQAQLGGEARAMVEGYLRALESMEMAKVRALYPSIGDADADAYAGLFRDSRAVQFNVKSISMASPAGTYDAALNSRTVLNVGVTFRQTPRRGAAPPPQEFVWPITLERVASGWRIVRVAQ